MPYVDRRARAARRHRIAVLHGSELNIAADGSLDWDDDFLAGFDVLVAFAIDTDAHAVPHLDYTRYGVAVGQRGWVGADEVINTWPLARLRRFLAKRRRCTPRRTTASRSMRSFDVGFPGEAQDGLPRGALQLDCGSPVCAHSLDWLTDGDVDRSPSRKAVLGPVHRPCPADGEGERRYAGLGGGDECAHVEGPQPWGAGQVALGEYHERLPGSDQGDEVGGVGHAVLALVSFDEHVAEPLEHEPAQHLALEHLAGDEAERGWQHRGEHDRVEPTRMVGHDDRGPAREVVEPMHGNRRPGEAGQEPDRPTDHLPAPLHPREQRE